MNNVMLRVSQHCKTINAYNTTFGLSHTSLIDYILSSISNHDAYIYVRLS